ncbi:hypothetical protein BST50_04230 [Vibrio vulnificus]|nr:hypothetical protein BST50_04230 [Vibrio vulnificus]PAO47183.1 hypothetical protein BST53_06660 [Vibrio vulnificus]PAO50843.1 hypothetical protein BST54_05100 [Vibrio vulnificus]PAO55040.1 hypothetical protein BST57_18845 [Vibrio vulnificus]
MMCVINAKKKTTYVWILSSTLMFYINYYRVLILMIWTMKIWSFIMLQVRIIVTVVMKLTVLIFKEGYQ